MTPPIPLNLRAALRSLAGILGLEVVAPWQWHEAAACFHARCRLSLAAPRGGLVPASTEWYIVADATYPWGRLKFCPAKAGGITATYPHQDYNHDGLEDRPWRGGEICLNTTLHTLGRHGFDTEPFSATGPASRLRWHSLRALDWLRAADEGVLMAAGDPFEVPQFPGATAAATTVAYAEGAGSFAVWATRTESSGLLELAPLRAKPAVLMVTRFLSSSQTQFLAAPWDETGVQADVAERGIWMRLPSAPVLPPWQAPRTWQELCQACRAQGVVLDTVLMRLFRHIRDGCRRILLVGFPMPERVGGPTCRMHWQPMRLPVLCRGDQSLPGFRPNRETTRYQLDKRNAIASAGVIEWLGSENWERGQLLSRGSLSAGVAHRHVLLLGGGALGSAVAELLVRAGVGRLTLMDDEVLQAGNLCRHTLTLQDLKTNKADGLARRLSQVGPDGVVDAIPVAFPPPDEESRQRLLACEVVIDCTADDRVLREMANFPWGGTKKFVSLSLGYGARRLFCFVADGPRFPCAAFQIAIQPWLLRESQEQGDVELPREGIGCWHPIFPARADDVWMLAAVAVKQLEAALGAEPTAPGLVVFEQRLDAGVFSGVVRVAMGGPDGG